MIASVAQKNGSNPGWCPLENREKSASALIIQATVFVRSWARARTRFWTAPDLPEALTS